MESRAHSAKLEWDHLSEREREVLGDLCSFHRQGLRYDWHPTEARPLDVGGSNGSHHSYTLGRLVKKGLAEHRKRGCEWGDAPTRWRGSKVYRATIRGLEVDKAGSPRPNPTDQAPS